MSSKNVLCTVHSKVSPFLQVLLLFNFSTSKSLLLILLVVFSKYFGFSILSNNYIINIDNANPTQSKVTRIIRKGTMFFILKGATPLVYFCLCGVVYVLVVALLAFCWKYAIYIKKRKANIHLELFPKLMFYGLLLFGQHILEFLSMILILILKQSLQSPSSKLYSDYVNYGLLIDPSNSSIASYIFGLLNLIFYILINISLFFSYYLINNPFHCLTAPLSLRHKQYSFYLVYIMNLSSLHYWEVFLTGTGLIVFKNITLVLVLGIIFFQIVFNLYKYERKNVAYYCMEVIGIYNLISILIEIMTTVQKYTYSGGEIIMLFILKIIITIILINYEEYLRARYFSFIAKTYLFEAFDHSHLKQIIESYYFLLDHLIALKQKENAYVLVDIISAHKKACLNEFCKCKLVQPFPKISTNNEQFKSVLLYNIGFLMETTFIHISNYSNIEIAIFLSDYYYHIKENILMAFSIIQSAFTLRRSKIGSIHILNLYYINQTFIKVYTEKFRLCPKSVKFMKIFEDLSTGFDFYKSMIKYGNTFDSLIDLKVFFENSIKFENDQDTGEVKAISSSLSNKESIWYIIDGLMKINKLSKEIKVLLKSPHAQKRGIEFYYIIYLFYLFFENKIPSKLIRKFSELTVGESFVGLSQREIHLKFEKLLDKYLSRTSSINHIIIKCSKGLLIKYFSSNLSNLLGFTQSSLIGEPFHSIFPKVLRESHSMAIYHTVINNNSFFLKKKTVIFDANEHYLPCELLIGVMPHFSKRLLIICEVQVNATKGTDFSFILDDKFNGISMSESAEQKYSITLNLIKKADFDAIDIFDISPKLLKENFAKDLELINDFQSEMKLSTIETYSRLLYHFNENSDLFGEREERKFKITSSSLKVNNKRKNSIPQLSNTNIKFSKAKSIITQNIMKALNKLSDSPLKEEKLKELNDNIIGLKKRMTEMNNLIEEDKDNLPKEVKSSKSMQVMINFNVELRVLYHMPIYFVHLMDSIPGNVVKKRRKLASIHQTNLIEGTKKDLLQIDAMLKNGVSLKKIKEKTNETMIAKTKNEMIVIIIAVVISFSISLYILIGEIDNIDKIIVAMHFLYMSRFHQEAILNYESTLFSFAFDFGGYTDMAVTDDELFVSFEFMTNALENSLTHFFNNLDIYNENLKENFYSFLQNRTYTKIVLNWLPITYQSDFILEVHYMVYLSRMISNERNKSSMQRDIEELFFNKYLDHPSNPINSPFGSVFFFASINVPLALSFSIQSVINEVTSKMIVYLNNNKQQVISFEAVCYISNLVFFFFVILFLRKYNCEVIRLIITMFMDNSQKKERNSFKNRLENTHMKQKIKLLIQLIHNFNEDNIRPIKLFLRENGNCSPRIGRSKKIISLNDNSNSSFINNTNPTLNLTNSANLTSTSHNLILRQNEQSGNNILKKLTSVKKNNKANNEQEDIDSILLVQLLQKKCISIINKYLVVIYMCILVNLLVSVLRFFNTLDYQSYSIAALTMFNQFTNFFMAMPTFFNSYRNKVIKKNATLTAYNNISSIFDLYQQGVIDATTSKSFQKFPLSALFWNKLNMKTNDPQINLEVFCFNEMVCLDIMREPNGVFSEGIYLGYKSIIQKTLQSFNDYRKLTTDKPDFTIEDLKEKIFTADFSMIQKNIEFVMHRVQSTYYLRFFLDYNTYAKGVENLTIYLNTAIFVIEIVEIFLIVFLIISRISKKMYQISFSCAKFNGAMFNRDNAIDINQ